MWEDYVPFCSIQSKEAYDGFLYGGVTLLLVLYNRRRYIYNEKILLFFLISQSHDQLIFIMFAEKKKISD